MSDQTDVEVHDVELAGEALLDVVDAHTAVAYEAGVWRDLRGATLTRRRKREMEGRTRTRKLKRRKVVVRPALEVTLKSPDGVKAKSAAMIEYEDEE